MEKIKSYYEEKKHLLPATFFILGVLFDILTLGQIDDQISIIQQGAYIGIIALMLHLDFCLPPASSDSFFAKIWSYRREVIHFFLGALLSVYTIFFFKSASLFNSFIFLSIMLLLLVGNEFERVKQGGHFIPYALLSLCVTCYWICIAPMGWGEIGWVPFMLGIIVSSAFMGFLYIRLIKAGIEEASAFKQVLLPSILINVLFVGLYAFAILPPVPLSINHIGIYHDIKKEGGKFNLFYDRPWWKFWERGAQSFKKRSGDELFCFVQIYSPSKFKENLSITWYKKNNKNEWKSWDTIPLPIVGGRAEGYRGYVKKSNYENGDWRVSVYTSDQREVGRIYLEVFDDNSGEPRVFRQDIY